MRFLKKFDTFNEELSSASPAPSPATKPSPSTKPSTSPSTKPGTRPSPIRRDKPAVTPAPKAEKVNLPKASAEDVIEKFKNLTNQK